MNRVMPRFALRLFAPCFLGTGLLAQPLPAFAAGYTVDIPNTYYSTGVVYGNSSDGGVTPDYTQPDGNTLNINAGGTVNSFATGADIRSNDAQSATGNTVNVNNGGTVQVIAIGAEAVSSYDAATASGNSAHVAAGGEVYVGVTGGSAQANTSSGSGAALASGNTVTIDGIVGPSGGIYGGSAHSGFGTGTATASGNVVTINDGASVNSLVTGGNASANSSYGSAIASNNRVIINGGTVNADVIGGYASGANGSAIDNTVTVKSSTGAAGTLKGGDLGLFTTGDAFSGNTLNLHSPGLTVVVMENFEKLNFYLPSTLGAGATMLTVTGSADLTNGAGRSSTVNVGIEGGSSPLQTGDRIILIDAGTLTTNGGLNTTANGQGMQGVTLAYEFDIGATGNRLIATVTGTNANVRAKSLSEGILSGAALLTQGGDAVAGQGMAAAVQSARLGRNVFGALSGGSSRYDTGSRVDIHSVSLLAGFSAARELDAGRLTLGAFLEYGNGSYDTHNSFAGAASVKGDGDLNHYGIGVLGRLDLKNGNYAEGSARAGRIENDYGSADLRDTQGRKAKYDARSAYASLHVGMGHIWQINETAAVDLYGKYFWTHQQGDSVRLTTGDPVKFSAIDSHRARLGARYIRALDKTLDAYAGLAYEHEFDGKAKAKTNGYRLDAPALEGDTGIAELGMTLKPAPTRPISLDIGLQGYVGQREGVTGNVRVRYEF
ncbi:MAG: autotransporter domain-containing protein [Azoarcus sp.]|jgi:outer membrane autotransporter protein|nr:autotransporter domain-containing protein [Azoarcus sp.]